jgi:hypothetical protein
MEVVLHFMGHYNEPPLALNFQLPEPGSCEYFKLEYNPCTGTSSWNVTQLSAEQQLATFCEFQAHSRKEDAGGMGTGIDEENPSFFAVYPRSDCRHVHKADEKVTLNISGPLKLSRLFWKLGRSIPVTDVQSAVPKTSCGTV